MGIIEEKFKWDGQLPKPSNMKFTYEDANALSDAGGSTGATLTIAASDSLHPERADYPCDGTNDVAQLQAAIDAIPASGGQIVASEGTFTWATAPVWKENIAFSGQGIGTKIVLTADITPFLLPNLSHTYFSDFYVWMDGSVLTKTLPIIYLTNSDRNIFNNKFDNIRIRQHGGFGAFSAIKLKADNSNTKGVWGNAFSRILIYNSETGIEFTTTNTGWINANTFKDIKFYIPRFYCITFANIGAFGSNGNIFLGMVAELQVGFLKGILMNASSANTNEFHATKFIDLPAGGEYLNIATGCEGNIFVGGGLTYLDNFTDNGANTIIIDSTSGVRAFKMSLTSGILNVNQNTIEDVLHMRAKGTNSYINMSSGSSAITVFGADYSSEKGNMWFQIANTLGNPAMAMKIVGMTDFPVLELLYGLKTNSVLEYGAGVGVTVDSCLIKDGYAHVTNRTPASASDTGVAGQTCYDSSYFYICTATDTWRRIAHATW